MTATAFIPNSSTPDAIKNNDDYLTYLLSQTAGKEIDIQISGDVIISKQIFINKAVPIRICGVSPNARLISRYSGIPLEIHSTYPGDHNPQQIRCILSNFTFIHAPSDSGAYPHIVADGTNIGKYLYIDNLTVSHFWPLIVDEKYEGVNSVIIRDAAGLNIYNLYCHNLNTGGLHLIDGYKVVLNNYLGRVIVNNRPLTLESCTAIDGQVYLEAYDRPPLFKNCFRCEKGLSVWSEFPGYPGIKNTDGSMQSCGYLAEIQHSQMSFYGMYGQDSNQMLIDNYSMMQCQFHDTIKPYGKLIYASNIGKLNYWPSHLATLVNNELYAKAFNDDGQQKINFPWPTGLNDLIYKPGDIFYVSGNMILSPESQDFYINKVDKKEFDLPIFRVTVNGTDVGQNIYVNKEMTKFYATGKATMNGKNPGVWLLFYGYKNCQLTVPLKASFSNISLWHVPS